MSYYDNYPMGTYAGDPDAPWNRPDDDDGPEYDADGYDEGGHFDATRVRRMYASVLERGREVRDDSLQV